MILVTGGTGSVGHALAEQWWTTPFRVFSRDEEKQRAMAVRYPDLDYRIGDIRDRDALRSAMDRVSVVVHAAALKQVQTGQRFPSEVVRTNVLGTENVCRVAAEFGARVILISTDKAVEPVNAYGASKMLAESIVTAAGGTVVRYGNVLGSRGSIVPVFRAQARAGVPLTVTDPTMTRFVFLLRQAVDLIAEAIDGAGPLLYPPDPLSATVGQFAEAIAPGHPLIIGGPRSGEKYHEKLAPGVTSDAARRISTELLADLIADIPDVL